MFKAIKYIYIITLLKKAKKHFIMLFIYFLSVIFLSLIFNDIIDVSSGAMVFGLIFLKWSINIIFIGLIFFSLIKIINLASNPLSVSKVEPIDDKKEKILSKDVLRSKTDIIIQKYVEEKL